MNQDDAHYLAALEASRSSAAQEADRRRRIEEEELRSLALLHKQEQAERHRREEERKRLEEEEIQRVMELSLREDWERRAQQEMLEHSILAQDSIQRGERPLSARLTAHSYSLSLAEPRNRRPLPSPPVPQHPSFSSALRADIHHEPLLTFSETGTAPSFESEHNSAGYYGRQRPESTRSEDVIAFTDSAEAPPAYDSVGINRPSKAHSCAPTGFWDEARAQRMTEEAAKMAQHAPAAESSRSITFSEPPGVTDERNVGMSSCSRQDDASSPPALPPRPSVETHTAPMPPVARAAHLALLDRPLSPAKDRSRSGSASGTDFPLHPIRTLAGPQSGQSDAAPATASPTLAQSVTTAPAQAPISVEDNHSMSAITDKTNLPRMGQQAPVGIDWGYSDHPFAMRLVTGPVEAFYRRGSAGQGDGPFVPESSSSIKQRFPFVIRLSAVKPEAEAHTEAPVQAGSAGNENCSKPFFTLRCGSWKLLLRSLAWLGNTRIETGPEEVAKAAADDTGGVNPILRVELEFVTPQISKGSGLLVGAAGIGAALAGGAAIQSGYGIDEYPAGSSLKEMTQRAKFGMEKRGDLGPAAFVSVCISLMSEGKASIARSGHLTANRSSQRELDMEYLKRGSSREVLTLPPWTMGIGPSVTTLPSRPSTAAESVKAGLELPCSALSLAERLKAAHRLSASCATSGYSARHSPRRLYQCIEAHDEKYVTRIVGKSLTQLTMKLSTSTLNSRVHGLNDAAYLAALSAAYSGGPALLLLDPSPILARQGDCNPMISPANTRRELWGPLFPTSSATFASSGRTKRQKSTTPEDGAASAIIPTSLGRAQSESSSSAEAVRQPVKVPELQSNGSGSGIDGAEYAQATGGELLKSPEFGDTVRSSQLARMKDRVRRKLKGRQGDVDDDDLANWITPLDLSEVG